jgi:hypothetical protein
LVVFAVHIHLENLTKQLYRRVYVKHADDYFYIQVDKLAQYGHVLI